MLVNIISVTQVNIRETKKGGQNCMTNLLVTSKVLAGALFLFQFI
jgi:hypothetical protein